jgi:uncharacterized protein YdbL (DUF1318 family)
MEKSEIIAQTKALKLPQGLVVRSLDGRFFFLSEDEIARKAVSQEMNAAVGAVFAKATERGVASPAEDEYCAWALNWLCTHEPLDEYWRRTSADWMNLCP